jgi:hypothetical protein
MGNELGDCHNSLSASKIKAQRQAYDVARMQGSLCGNIASDDDDRCRVQPIARSSRNSHSQSGRQRAIDDGCFCVGNKAVEQASSKQQAGQRVVVVCVIVNGRDYYFAGSSYYLLL